MSSSMPETPAAVAESAPADARALTLVDCDIHPMPPFGDLTSLLSTRTRQHLERYGRQERDVAVLAVEWRLREATLPPETVAFLARRLRHTRARAPEATARRAV